MDLIYVLIYILYSMGVSPPLSIPPSPKTDSSHTVNLQINTGEINTRQLNNFFKKKIENTCEGKTKTQYLLKNTKWKAGERPKYMKELTRQEASIIFKARTRMLDVKNNFRGKYKDTKCRKCPENIETQELVLETCPGIHNDPSTKITTNDIFENDTKKLKNTLRVHATKSQSHSNPC